MKNGQTSVFHRCVYRIHMFPPARSLSLSCFVQAYGIIILFNVWAECHTCPEAQSSKSWLWANACRTADGSLLIENYKEQKSGFKKLHHITHCKPYLASSSSQHDHPVAHLRADVCPHPPPQLPIQMTNSIGHEEKLPSIRLWCCLRAFHVCKCVCMPSKTFGLPGKMWDPVHYSLAFACSVCLVHGHKIQSANMKCRRWWSFGHWSIHFSCWLWRPWFCPLNNDHIYQSLTWLTLIKCSHSHRTSCCHANHTTSSKSGPNYSIAMQRHVKYSWHFINLFD